MANKKIVRLKSKKRVRLLLFGSSCLLIIGGILTTITTFWIDIYQKYQEKEKLEKQLLELKTEEEALTIDVERLQDPEYVARYLREKYFYSKDGEYIIKIPEESKK